MNRILIFLSDWLSNGGRPDRQGSRGLSFELARCRSRLSSLDKPATGDTTMRLNVLLWVVRGLLALIFLFTGGMKLVLPLEALTGPIPLPGLFMRFLGVAEVLGAIGLILPGLLGIRPGLTPLAAAGLVIIMIGATVITVLAGSVAQALVPLTIGLLAASVAYATRPVQRAAANGA
jgi:uncharacterized membrane protein YphA (DoxX/SURF4 family)